MSPRAKLLIVVVFLTLLGGGTAAYKNAWLGVPFWSDRPAGEWLVEAKVSFVAGGKPVRASLALPPLAVAEGTTQESASAGYGYHLDPADGRPRAVWTARERSGPQALYYRLRVTDRDRTGAELQPPDAEVPVATKPLLPASLLELANSATEAVRSRSADTDSLFIEVFTYLQREAESQELGVLRRHYEQEGGTAAGVLLGIDMLRLAGVPARPAYGARLEDARSGQSPVRLVEYFDGIHWKVRDPLAPTEPLSPARIFVWHRGESPLSEVFGGENSRVLFTVVRERIPLERIGDLRDQPFLISTIHALPASERAVFRYVVLIPLGAFIIVLMRNLIGIPTLGTFMPVLLALALLEMPLASGITIFAILIAIGLWMRFLLSRLNLLVVPRVAACVVIVTLLMMLLSAVGYKLGLSSGLQITLFPMIILAWTIERMSLIWEEEGPRNAIMQVGGSVAVAVVAFLFMRVRQVQYWAFNFPELLLVLLAAILLLGRYTGYRLTELVRFRNFSAS